MAKITYTDHEGSAETTEAHGVRFKSGEAIETHKPELIEMARSNPFFELEDDEPDDTEGDTPYDRGVAAAAAGKTRQAPAAWRKKPEGAEWLEGFDSHKG